MNIPGYTDLEEISKGGFGSIFKARGALDKRRKVAIKVGEPDQIDQERMLLKGMKHDNVVEVLDHGEGWYAMPEADACLREVVGTFSVDEAVEVGKQLASALDYIHNLEHVHRDIKPDNILFVNGKPKLADMGLCQRVETHVGSWDKTADKAGTDHYVAPEVEAGEPFDHRADLFSLGMTLYELVTGENRMLKPIEHSGFNEIVNKLTEPNPNKRYGSAKELIKDLGKLARGAVASQMVEQPVINPKEKNNYWPTIVGMGLLGSLAVIGIGSWIADFIPMPEKWRDSDTKAPLEEKTDGYESQNKVEVKDYGKYFLGGKKEIYVNPLWVVDLDKGDSDFGHFHKGREFKLGEVFLKKGRRYVTVNKKEGVIFQTDEKNIPKGYWQSWKDTGKIEVGEGDSFFVRTTEKDFYKVRFDSWKVDERGKPLYGEAKLVFRRVHWK
jgi:serine/threonine protein kinase